MTNSQSTERPTKSWPAAGSTPASGQWLKASIARGEAVLGLMVTEIKTPMLGAILDAAGMHFAIIDQEHGAFGADLLASLIAGFRGGACRPLVRIPATRREYVLTALELGAAGIVVPHVESRRQAEDIVRYARYAPEGDRGLSLCRAHTGFRRVEQGEYLRRANAEVLVVAQIETRAAVDNLDDILATPGLDMVFIGPSDLSLSCGIDGSLRAPEMRRLVDRILSRARHFGVSTGIQTYDPDVAAELVAAGVSLVSCNTDLNALFSGLALTADALRQKVTAAAGAARTTPEGA